MTRSRTLALVTLLAGLLSLASVTAVSAGPCTESAYRQCAVGVMTNAPISFNSAVAVSPVSARSCTSYAREHCEQIAASDAVTNDVETFATIEALACTSYAPEHCEQMAAQIALVAQTANP